VRNEAMTNPALREAQLSPLDQIRLAEADVTRKIAMARKDREHTLTKAKAQAKVLLDEARESGKRKGQTQYREIVSEAEEEARAILAESDHRAEEIRQKGIRYMDIAIRQVVNIITGMEEGAADI
jgi:vacuolar-type H+-ATPase subunit H